MPTIDDYATPLKMPMTIDGFSRFPALAGYKAELRGGNVEPYVDNQVSGM